MKYAFIGAKARVKESYIPVSDGVELLAIDFIPDANDKNLPVLVFVPGWISLVSGWEGVLLELIKKYHVIYLETREKKSARLPEKKVAFTVERMSQDIHEVLPHTAAADKPFYLAGSSLGGAVILDYMSRDFVMPREAFLVSPIAEMHFPALAVFIIKLIPPFLYFIVKPWIKWYLKNIRCDKEKEPEQVKKYERTLDAAEPYRLKKNAVALVDYQVWDRLDQVAAPVLIIGAKADSLHGMEELEKMRDNIPDASMAVLESNKESHSEKCGAVMTAAIKSREKNCSAFQSDQE